MPRRVSIPCRSTPTPRCSITTRRFFAEHGLSVPTTWDELVETCRAIRDITGAPAFGWDNLAGSFMTLLLQNGGRYTDQNGNLYFATEDSDITLKVLQMWQDNVNEGIWRTAGEDQFFSGPFANEMIPMYIGDSVEASYIPRQKSRAGLGNRPCSSGERGYRRQPVRRPCHYRLESGRKSGQNVCGL